MASAGAAVGSAPGRRFPGSPQSESDRPADRASRCRMWSRECRHQHPALRCLPPDDDPHTGWGSLAPWASLGRWGASGGRNWGAGLIERGVADWIADLLRHGGEPWGCARRGGEARRPGEGRSATIPFAGSERVGGLPAGSRRIELGGGGGGAGGLHGHSPGAGAGRRARAGRKDRPDGRGDPPDLRRRGEWLAVPRKPPPGSSRNRRRLVGRVSGWVNMAVVLGAAGRRSVRGLAGKAGAGPLWLHSGYVAGCCTAIGSRENTHIS